MPVSYCASELKSDSTQTFDMHFSSGLKMLYVLSDFVSDTQLQSGIILNVCTFRCTNVPRDDTRILDNEVKTLVRHLLIFFTLLLVRKC